MKLVELLAKVKGSWKVLLLVFLLSGAAGVANWLGFVEVGSFISDKVPAAEVQ